MSSSPTSNERTEAADRDPEWLPGIDDIRAAAERIAGAAIVTPLLEARAIGEALGARVFVKAEVLQRTGSFKFRGAYNRLSRLSAEEKKRGVVAFSSGNHAQGVAAAARALAMPAVIVMPSDAPTIKLENTRAYGADVVTYDRASGDREAIAAKLTRERGAILVPSYDDPFIIAGQGTLGLEAAAQLKALGITPDLALAPIGGGGLISGTSTALKDAYPGIEIWGVEPAGFDDHCRSFAAGRRVGAPAGARSFCDALLVAMPGRMTFAINRRTLAGAVAVTDTEVAYAMAAAFRDLKLVVEPGGAAGLAGLLARKVEARKRTVLVVLSGGNVDRATFCGALAQAEAAAR
jgi:threonine dehydratase